MIGIGMYRNNYYLLRHAEVDRSKDVHFSEHELTQKGHEQARNLVPILRSSNISEIFCSPFKRAIQTIEPYSASFTLDDRISGRIVGDLPKEQTWKFFKESWNDFNFTKHGAESATQCADRINAFKIEVEQNFRDKNILVVSHSNPIAFYLNTIDPLIDYNWFKNMKAPSLYRIYFEGSKKAFEELSIDI